MAHIWTCFLPLKVSIPSPIFMLNFLLLPILLIPNHNRMIPTPRSNVLTGWTPFNRVNVIFMTVATGDIVPMA